MAKKPSKAKKTSTKAAKRKAKLEEIPKQIDVPVSAKKVIKPVEDEIEDMHKDVKGAADAQDMHAAVKLVAKHQKEKTPIKKAELEEPEEKEAPEEEEKAAEEKEE